jgi:hypothetical protein
MRLATRKERFAGPKRFVSKVRDYASCQRS